MRKRNDRKRNDVRRGCTKIKGLSILFTIHFITCELLGFETIRCNFTGKFLLLFLC